MATTRKRILMHHDDDDNVKEHICKRTKRVPGDADKVSIVLASVSLLLVDDVLCELLATRLESGQYKASIGSTDAGKGSQYLKKQIIDNANSNLITQNDN